MTTINNISIYIPHIFYNISKDKIVDILDKSMIGKVSNIDLIYKLNCNGDEYNAAYIHFEYWYDTVEARNFQENILNPHKEARLMYEDPWYWLVLENISKKYIKGDRKQRIDTSENLSSYQPQKNMEVKQLSNTDFADMYKTPTKNTNTVDVNVAVSDEEFKQFCRDVVHDLKDIEADIEEENQMDEVEQLMDEEEKYLKTFDSRYVQALEQENMYFKMMDSQYFENLGRYEHQVQHLLGENMSLKSELDFKKSQLRPQHPSCAGYKASLMY